MALKGNCDNSGTILLRWSPHWHPLITVLAIKGRGRATIRVWSRPPAFPHLTYLRPRRNGPRDDIIRVLFNPHSLRSHHNR